MSFVSYVGRQWYAAISIALTLCFVALACLWVHLVPVFQSPDEPAHFDYAFALATAGTLLRAADGPAGYDPRVATAMRDANQARIAFHVNERVARSYESGAYRKTIRAENEALRAYSPRDPNTVRPALTSVYPFVPYVLYAIAAYPFRGDVISALYACRFASVAFSAIGILFWSRILLRLRVGKTHALALLAIVAFFPLTSFVSSYVQPDGVAFLIVSALLFVTLRIRDGRADTAHGIAYALLLAALCGSKLQFAVAVGIATLGPVAFAYSRIDVSRRLRAFVSITIVVSSTLVFAATRWVMHGSGAANYFDGKRTLISAFPDHASSGVLSYVLDESRLAIYDLFGAGMSARSFWGWFGWLDTPIRLVDYRTTDAFGSGEEIGTALVAIALAVVIALRLRRLARIARERTWSTALRLATSDPVFNAYLIFTVLIGTLYITSNNVFGAQGRDWYAFEVVAFACASWYGTRVLPKRWRRGASAIVLVSLATYASVGSAYALTTIEDRYYRTLSTESVSDVARLIPSKLSTGLTVDDVSKAGSRLTMSGWAYDSTAALPCRAMYAVVDDRFDHWIRYGLERDDVGRMFGRFDLARTGFTAVVDVSGRHPGRYRVAVACVSASGLQRFTPTSVGELVNVR